MLTKTADLTTERMLSWLLTYLNKTAIRFKMTAQTRHFEKAAVEIAQYGDNDTLPHDVDCKFIGDNAAKLAKLAAGLYERVQKIPNEKAAITFVNGLDVFSERLLVPTGSAGFRVTTKIHPFWNVYLNGLALCIAEQSEPLRSNSAHSYRLSHSEENAFFDRSRSWRAYKEAVLSELESGAANTTVVQTDISSFYEHIYHHRLENIINDLFDGDKCIGGQIARFLSKLASGRSFGLPVGGQCSRVLAEVMMMPIDQILTEKGLIWHRYVDDFTLICSSQQAAYEALSTLSYALADYGLTLNRTKTTILSSKNYVDCTRAQLGAAGEEASALQEVDLYFDPYSDARLEDYENLRDIVGQIDISFLLNLELDKTTPDNFILSQISRSLQFQTPQLAIDLCKTILDPANINAFRASWATIMRGITAVRQTPELETVAFEIDDLVDQLPDKVGHLLQPEANVLHYLKLVRLRKTDRRGIFVRTLYHRSGSQTVRRACIDCWRHWKDRANFIMLRNSWSTMQPEEQRMFYLALNRFGDEGSHSRSQLRLLTKPAWRLAFEDQAQPEFAEVYRSWAEDAG